MKITLKTTKHNTTQEEQWKKFLGELLELQEAIYKYEHFNLVDRTYDDIMQYLEDIVNEGLDVCKSLQKWISQGYKHCLKSFDIDTMGTRANILFEVFEIHLQELQEERDYFVGASATIISLLNYLVKFSQENELNFEQMLKEHDELLEKRGVKMKVYIDEQDIEMIGDLLHFDTMPEEYKERLKRMIEDVEK